MIHAVLIIQMHFCKFIDSESDPETEPPRVLPSSWRVEREAVWIWVHQPTVKSADNTRKTVRSIFPIPRNLDQPNKFVSNVLHHMFNSEHTTKHSWRMNEAGRCGTSWRWFSRDHDLFRSHENTHWTNRCQASILPKLFSPFIPTFTDVRFCIFQQTFQTD